MKDIEKAIEKEQEYLEHRTRGEEPFPLIDAIKMCGFDGLDEYHKAKREYEFNQLQFTYEECRPDTCLLQVFQAILNGQTIFQFMISDTTFVFNCRDDFNKDFCDKHNIPVYYTEANGGTIVSTSGDVSLCICIPENLGVDDSYILSNIASILSQYTDGIVVDGNDILQDGRKILGSATYRQNGMYALVAHMSFNDNSSLISQICLKPMAGKIPGSLRNISPEQFREEVIRWLRIK